MTNITKICSKCGKEKLLSDFYKDLSKKDCLSSSCKECINQSQKEYYLSHKEYYKKYNEKHKGYRKIQKRIWDKLHMKERRIYKQINRDKEKNKYLILTYGITLDDYNKMLEAQNGVCAICGQKETRKSKYNDYTLSVDHDHKTGKVRGLLCHGCNNCLGTLKEDIEIFQNAINYLKIHKD